MGALEAGNEQPSGVCICQKIDHVPGLRVGVGLYAESKLSWEVVDWVDERHANGDLACPGGLVHEHIGDGDLAAGTTLCGVGSGQDLNLAHVPESSASPDNTASLSRL